MKIMVQVGGYGLGIEANEKTGAILEGLTSAKIYSHDYTGRGGYEWKPVAKDGEAEEISISIVNDSTIKAKTPIVEETSKAVEAANKSWSEYYNRAIKAEKELAELKAKIAAVTEAKAETKPEAAADEMPF